MQKYTANIKSVFKHRTGNKGFLDVNKLCMNKTKVEIDKISNTMIKLLSNQSSSSPLSKNLKCPQKH